MISKTTALMICIGITTVSVGCRTLPVGGSKASKSDKQGKESRLYASTKEVRVGKVTLVNPKDAFLLIRSERGLLLPDEAPLEVRDVSGEVIAELELSAEQSGLDLVADIQSGSPERGQTVFFVFEAARSGSVEVEERFKKSPSVSQEETGPIVTPVSLSDPSIEAKPTTQEIRIDDTVIEEELPEWVTPEG